LCPFAPASPFNYLLKKGFSESGVFLVD
jgi:hypothetical protein